MNAFLGRERLRCAYRERAVVCELRQRVQMLVDAFELDQNCSSCARPRGHGKVQSNLNGSAKCSCMARSGSAGNVLGDKRRKVDRDADEAILDTAMLEEHRRVHLDEIFTRRLDDPASGLNDSGADRTVEDRGSFG